MTAPPNELDGARVLWLAWSGEEPFGELCDSEGQQQFVHGLAVCTYDTGLFYRFSCDSEWQVVQDSFYDSEESAKNAIPENYDASRVNWVEMRIHRAGLISEIVQRCHDVFPTLPIPEYPTGMGLDPIGDDEYASFANRPWSQVEPDSYSSLGYDISPAIGFSLHDSPHMWNYYLPGFMSSCLLHDGEHEIADSFLWRFRDLPVPPRLQVTQDPWWGGTVPMENYRIEQRQLVIRFLEFMRDYGSSKPFYYQWERNDDRTLSRWLA